MINQERMAYRRMRDELLAMSRALDASEAARAALREGLVLCQEAFNEIRADWTDPRDAIRKGWKAIHDALAKDKELG